GAVRHPEAAPRPQPVLDINGQRFTLRAPSVVLGRSSAADITVEDTGVSRRHLEILHQDGVYLAVDLGSTNGSTVDGERLRGRRELTDGSVITMGRTTIVFRLLTPRSGTAWPQS
ncbi:FHA domain-containing protein, partial [Rothia kristinae]